MELSIQRSTVLALAVVAGAGGYLWLKGAPPGLPPAPSRPGTSAPPPAPPAAAPPRSAAPTPAPPPLEPTVPRPGREPAPVEAPAAGRASAAPRRERTPDERARSLIAVAEGYAENGRYDLAFEKLEAAQALGPTELVQEEVRRATDAVTERMRAARRR